MLALFSACGRPASDIVHAPNREESPSLNETNRGNLDNTSNLCASGEILLSQNREKPVCVKSPDSRELPSISLWTFWTTSTIERCADISTFAKAYQRSHMPSATITVNFCKPVTRTEKSIFVNIDIIGPKGKHTEAFEIASSQNDSAIIRICTAERTQYLENMHCSEVFKPAQIPASLAAVAPMPDAAIVDFYPTLLTLLSN
jgi:hypothetical protein